MADAAVIRIKPFYYIHVLDNNANVTRVEVGPQTFTRKDHEKIVQSLEPMIMVPPRHYCIIGNPVITKAGHPDVDNAGQVKLRHGDQEIRFASEPPEPFALFPGERLVGKVSPLQVVAPNSALRLRCIRDFTDNAGNKRYAGDEWLFPGPATYLPRIEEQIDEVVRSVIIQPNQAIKLRARQKTIDQSGKERLAGEEWLVKHSGAFLPGVYEEILETVDSVVLTEDKALHLRAVRTFTDVFGKVRKAGEEWLVTSKDAETHIPDVSETVVGETRMTTLTNRQYCVVLDPHDRKGRPQLGKKELRKGECTFFLQPGESLENNIQPVYVLSEQETLLLSAREAFKDEQGAHQPGDRWLITGPSDYVPRVEVEILERRKRIPLDENEGIYVRDVRTGNVRIVSGESYMLKPNEELWPKDLPAIVEEILANEYPDEFVNGRDPTRAVTYRIPHNSAVQIYDYREKKSRVVFGPDLVMLGPDEHFTLVSLSGGKPKKPHVIKSLALKLGPDFMTDVINVETSDHARLSLKLSYNWHFDIDKKDQAAGARLFSVPDFVGDACKAIAARVRGAVAAESFDEFHKSSAKIIRLAVFGTEDDGSVRNAFAFNANNLIITNIDIQEVEPVDQRTRDSLQKSVQLAIEITTKSQEANATHEAARREQDAKGKLDRQRILDDAEAEKINKHLLQLRAESSAVETTGQATAEARARAEAAQIEGEANVKMAKLRADAQRIRSEAELNELRAKQTAELSYQKTLSELEIAKAQQLSQIDSQKFGDIVGAIGPDTIEAIAAAGPEMQAKLLEGLGLKGYMIMDGNNPINLFQTASGLISHPRS